MKRKRKNVRLYVVGTGPAGYIRYLKALCRKLGISQNIHWHGYCNQTKVRRMYASHGAVIMPSLQESFVLVALEALANGIPLVSTRAGGLSEFVNNKVAQTITKVETRAISIAIQKMWNNKKLTDQRVVSGRKLASRYQWSNAARQYINLF